MHCNYRLYSRYNKVKDENYIGVGCIELVDLVLN